MTFDREQHSLSLRTENVFIEYEKHYRLEEEDSKYQVPLPR